MLRRGAAVALAVVALALLMPAPTAAAQSQPRIFLNPDCAPENASSEIEVSGEGFFGGPDVEIFFQGQQVGFASAGEDGSFPPTPVKVAPPQRGWYHIEARGESFDFARATLRSPCSLSPRVGLTPTCSATGPRELTVEGFDFPARNDTRITWDVGGATEFEINSATDENGYVIETFKIEPIEERDYIVTVDDYGVYGATARAVYRVPCPPTTTSAPTTTSSSTTTTTAQTTTTAATTTTTTTTIPPSTPGSTLTVNPALGRPGTVTIARGTGFTPGPVTLTWDRGIGRTAAIAGDDGTFQVQVLVFPNDVLGPRNLVAAGAVTTATTPFLVVPNSMKPAGRDVAQIVRAHRYLHR